MSDYNDFEIFSDYDDFEITLLKIFKYLRIAEKQVRKCSRSNPITLHLLRAAFAAVFEVPDPSQSAEMWTADDNGYREAMMVIADSTMMRISLI